jgi:hypothetical protein
MPMMCARPGGPGPGHAPTGSGRLASGSPTPDAH